MSLHHRRLLLLVYHKQRAPPLSLHHRRLLLLVYRRGALALRGGQRLPSQTSCLAPYDISLSTAPLPIACHRSTLLYSPRSLLLLAAHNAIADPTSFVIYPGDTLYAHLQLPCFLLFC